MKFVIKTGVWKIDNTGCRRPFGVRHHVIKAKTWHQADMLSNKMFPMGGHRQVWSIHSYREYMRDKRKKEARQMERARISRGYL